MYIQNKIKELEQKRDALQYEIQDIEYEQNDKKIKIFSDVQMFEGDLIKESDIPKLEKEIKEREKKISLINKMIRKKTEKYREQLQRKKQKEFREYERKIESRQERIKSLTFNEKVHVGSLVGEIETLTGNQYTPKIKRLRGDICSLCAIMSFTEAMDTLYKDEYDLFFDVEIGPFSFPSKVRLDDETVTYKRVYEYLEKVGNLGACLIGSRVKFKYGIDEIKITIDERTFNAIYDSETELKKKHILSQAISNVVEKHDTFNKNSNETIL